MAGDTPVDRQIRNAQAAARATSTSAAALERLGWLYVVKARESFDEHYYALAEQTSRYLEQKHPDPGTMTSARLLRGHVWHSQHRFKEAEQIARDLVTRRGAPFDHGLLGDALMEMGRLNDAAAEYQAMMDLRPDSQAFARAAHLRWLRGDLPGAILAINESISAAGRCDRESAAWMQTRLGFYQLASNDAAATERACEAALQLHTNYAPACFLLGRARLAAGECAEAIEPLQRAARIVPLPEHEWALAEALFEAGRFDEARATEAQLRQHGLAYDARSFALFLATRREQTPFAVSLLEQELERRADVFTHDALAWALASDGRIDAAWPQMEQALGAGTMDGRLFFHAAVIASKAGRAADAQRYQERAWAFAHTLLPSEKRQLSRLIPISNKTNQSL